MDVFLTHVHMYKDSIQYKKSENNKLKRALYNFRLFGSPYVWYQLSRIGLLGFLENMQGTFFSGKKMVLPAGDMGTSVFSMYGILPHKSERRLTLWIMKNLEDSAVFYDIGAHMGYYTALSEKILTSGEVHAFEANGKLCKYLNRNFSNSKNVHIVCAAITDSPGEVDFYDAIRDQDSSASSRFLLSDQYNSVPSKVAAITIDEYIRKENRPPTVMKLDIEGGEYDAILGALDTLRENSPSIIMEIWSSEKGRKYSDKAVKKLQELGYEAFLIKSDGSAGEESVRDPVGTVSGRGHDTRDNFLFLKK